MYEMSSKICALALVSSLPVTEKFSTYFVQKYKPIGKHRRLSLLFNKVACARLFHKCFLVNFLRTPFLQGTGSVCFFLETEICQEVKNYEKYPKIIVS